MTAFETIENRVTITERIIAWRAEGEALANDLALAGYDNPSQLAYDRGKFMFAVNVADVALGHITELGTDLEARD